MNGEVGSAPVVEVSRVRHLAHRPILRRRQNVVGDGRTATSRPFVLVLGLLLLLLRLLLVLTLVARLILWLFIMLLLLLLWC